MPAGANGKLYGAVTAQTIVDELTKQGFQIERKRIEIPGNTIKSVGKYRITIKLYESAAAECPLSIEGQPVKTETKAPPPPRGRRRDAPAEGLPPENAAAVAGNGQSPEGAAAPEAPPAPQDASPADTPAEAAGDAAQTAE